MKLAFLRLQFPEPAGGGERGGAGAGAQPISMFTVVNAQFGCESKPKSMFTRTNIDFDCVVKPISAFVFTNIDFGCGVKNADPALAAFTPCAYPPKP